MGPRKFKMIYFPNDRVHYGIQRDGVLSGIYNVRRASRILLFRFFFHIVWILINYIFMIHRQETLISSRR